MGCRTEREGSAKGDLGVAGVGMWVPRLTPCEGQNPNSSMKERASGLPTHPCTKNKAKVSQLELTQEPWQH